VIRTFKIEEGWLEKDGVVCRYGIPVGICFVIFAGILWIVNPVNAWERMPSLTMCGGGNIIELGIHQGGVQ